MKRPLDELLRDPRAHHGSVDEAEVQRWSSKAVLRWQASEASANEAVAELAAAAGARWRVRWQDLGLYAACAMAVAVLLPIFAPQLLELGPAIAEAPWLWMVGAGLVVIASVPQLRELVERLAAG